MENQGLGRAGRNRPGEGGRGKIDIETPLVKGYTRNICSSLLETILSGTNIRIEHDFFAIFKVVQAHVKMG